MSAVAGIGEREKQLLLFLGVPVLGAACRVWHCAVRRATWFLEVAPVVIAAPIIAVTWRRFPLTTLLCVLIAFACARAGAGWRVHVRSRSPRVRDAGGPRTRAKPVRSRRPFHAGLRSRDGCARDPGARRIRERTADARLLAACVALAISAFYELIEWWAALALGQCATDFLGTQGDPWDTQAYMFCALAGAAVALIVLAPAHDRQIAGVNR